MNYRNPMRIAGLMVAAALLTAGFCGFPRSASAEDTKPAATTTAPAVPGPVGVPAPVQPAATPAPEIGRAHV